MHYQKVGFGKFIVTWSICVMLIASILWLSASFPMPAQPSAAFAFPSSSINGKIVFVSQSTAFSQAQISAINPDGSGGIGICNGLCHSASLSRDGTKVVYDTTQFGPAGGGDIYVQELQGGTTAGLPKQLTNNDPIRDAAPRWSYDGKKIAFARDRDGSRNVLYSVYVMDSDGSNVKRLTNSTDNEFPASWSPDGKMMLFYKSVTVDNFSTTRIYVMNATDGTGRTLLTDAFSNQEGRWSPDGKKILLTGTATKDGQTHVAIFTINPDGSGLARLTGNEDVTGVSFSPDGSRIAFSSNREGGVEIYVMNTDGSDVKKLTNGKGDFESDGPIWSPDGKEIAFEGTRNILAGQYIKGVYIMNADGSGDKRLVIEGFTGQERPVQWVSKPVLPTVAGGKIVFVSDRDGNNEIYVMNDDGTNQTRLTHDTADDAVPKWSPDGTKIEFLSNRTGSYGLYTMNADGSNLNKLTSNFGIGAWSPDGTRIAFARNIAGNSEIFVSNPDGTGATNLTNNQSYDSSPTWSPDGSKIAFASNRDNMWQILTMNPDGSNLTSIARAPGAELLFGGGLSWSPDGNKLAFIEKGTIFGFQHLDIMPIDGNSLSFAFNIITYGGFDWSPDGSKIVSTNGYYAETNTITVLNLNNGNSTDLVPQGSKDYGPIWSPDGSRIAFNRNTDGKYAIFTMNADGTNQTRLTYNNASDSIGDWVSRSSSPAPSKSELKVNSVDLAGNSISGIWTTVTSMNGTLLKSGYTPFTFSGSSGAEYKVRVENFDGKVFSKWLDDGDKDGTLGKSHMVVLPPSDITTSLTAVYDTGDSLRGITPLTYMGTPNQPTLTIVAKSLDDDNNTNDLHMYAIIDPQSVNGSSTTYKVYAGNYGNIVFDHWSDGSKERIREFTISEPAAITAFYIHG